MRIILDRSLAELKNWGFPAYHLRWLGYTAAEMLQAGFSVQELISAGWSQRYLLVVVAQSCSSIIIADLKAAGFVPNNASNE